MAASLLSSLSISRPYSNNKTLNILTRKNLRPHLQIFFKIYKFPSQIFLCSRISSNLHRCALVSGKNHFANPPETTNYEFSDGSTEVELRFDLSKLGFENSNDIFVDVDDISLLIRVKENGILRTLMQTNCLFDRVKPAETIWYIDEDQLVVNLKKREVDLQWPGIMESWESLRLVAPQLLKGTSIYVIGECTEINEEVAKVLAVGLGYTPLSTSEVLERCAGQSIDSWIAVEGVKPVAEAEALVLQSVSSHVRAVVATLGGHHGAAVWNDKWQHLHAGFTVWLSKTKAASEESAREEAKRNMRDGGLAYANADVVVKLVGWDKNHAQEVALGCLRALKQLILSDKQITGKKSLYIRLGCRGDWPNIKPPGWDPSCGHL